MARSRVEGFRGFGFSGEAQGFVAQVVDIVVTAACAGGVVVVVVLVFQPPTAKPAMLHD